MARVGRLAGAILAESHGEFYLVGNTKVPCDFAAAGFEPPIAIDALKRPFIPLSPCRPTKIEPPHIVVEVEGDALPRLLADAFLIERTGSVSERLWRLARGQSDEDARPSAEVVHARWLGEVPQPIWRIVRDAVLRCT
jgi:hypothetical protein